MSISIIVERSPADRQGPDIVNSLIASEAQALQAGRAEIDTNSTDRFTVSGSSPISSYMEPGKIVQISDLQKGTYKSMLRNFSSSLTMQAPGSFSATTSVIVEREA
jgi:hypothetical protein